MRVELTKTYKIEAAHRAPGQGRIGAHLHGHTFRIEIQIEGDVDEKVGWLIDYGEISDAFRPMREILDHSYLNEVIGLEDAPPEAVASWIKERLQLSLPMLKDVLVYVDDAQFRAVELDADPVRHLPRRLKFSFSAAQSLPNLPEGHPCRNLHGHTYRVEVGAKDLVRLAGHLRALHTLLDHTNLDDVPGLSAATSEHLCAWIWKRLCEWVDDLIVIVVQETDSARCIYRGQ